MSDPKPLPAISMVTLGVDELARATTFYEALGWSNSAQSQENVRFLIGRNITLGLFGRKALAEDAGVEADDDVANCFSGVALATNQNSRADVDAFFERAIAAGATVAKQPQEVFWGGYSGYFKDLDGHLWEVAHNPFVALKDDGVMQLTVPE